MGLTVYSNSVVLATWSTVFPNFNTEADYHHWRLFSIICGRKNERARARALVT
jgi:hypothetical protein